ncbi:class I SAM-dependent methyltransferase [Myceligenerans pegani]|uniref:Class I SAM-dependent methyltransferase n=1 Tax=Myceligenerans pegani TaxID=2776917 RepID=A0ABR9N447_9MICO|nr:class I SAM-dependent methyltransferase [Myceligenerans sp. TRM 65318]MBE1878448.1 class I SAM-dependent methyltransferase [Myceligenerans sp. TRM 65318]MBE3020719.1 class I SAM-dependent methyltransferase [Myceligenerans sp. TRM 65318]
MDPAEFWSTGDYAVVGDLWAQPGRDLAATLPVQGRDVVDLATGTGITAIAAALHGARSVVGVDVTPGLLREAARRADAAGADVTWLTADFTTVPLPDHSADLVTSTFGIVFAADPAAALAEARRLTRPGGRIVFTSWSTDGLFGRVRRTLAPFFPGAPEPWHERPDGIRTVAGADAQVSEESFDMTVESPERFVTLLEQHSAPIILGAASLGGTWPEAREQLVATVRDAAGQAGEPTDGGIRLPVGYLRTTLRY